MSTDAAGSDESADVRCYCFGITVEDLRRDGPTHLAFVETKIRAGECDCARLNPRGRCCLGDLRAVVHPGNHAGDAP